MFIDHPAIKHFQKQVIQRRNYLNAITVYILEFSYFLTEPLFVLKVLDMFSNINLSMKCFEIISYIVV